MNVLFLVGFPLLFKALSPQERHTRMKIPLDDGQEAQKFYTLCICVVERKHFKWIICIDLAYTKRRVLVKYLRHLDLMNSAYFL